ncbi:MAG: phosphoribosylformylglycinamidine synthase subunit PurL [Armatimonadia bacterium]
MELDERRLPVSKMNDTELRQFMDDNGVGLTVGEARQMADFLGRDPTYVEMHIFNSEWSEHCSYKSSRPTLKEFLHTTGPNVMLGPQEDAGIVYFTHFQGKKYGIVMAHESHNHPSQVLPNEGAATGIGGIVRDVDCMGARVIATADPLRFGDPEGKWADRTKWIVDGVVDGIWQYGNALGVPCLGGDVYFSSTYDDNCLVNVVSLGLVAEEDIIHSFVPPQAADVPYDLILIGKPTDDSGFGGSAFASKIISEEEQESNRGAVQVPDPFLKNVLAMRKANEAVRARAKELKIPIGMKDIGGGGLACGTSEIVEAGGFGVNINLDDVNMALADMLPETVCCAETQERYLIAVPETFTPEVLAIYNEHWDLPNVYEGARAGVIGKIVTDRRYRLIYGGKIVCDAPIEKVTSGILYERKEQPKEFKGTEPVYPMPKLPEAILKVLGNKNVCSRMFIYRAYDSEVQGNAVIRPGEAGAGVCAPLEGSMAGCALSVDGNPYYGDISAYWGGANAVAEAMRNVASVGATPAALTDCLNFGNPEVPEAFWEFREGVRGLADAAKSIWLKGYENQPVPIVSGNVSLYNESAAGSAVSPSAVIACVGVMDDYSKAVTMQFKRPGDKLFLVGERKNELGGSAFYQALGLGLGANVPQLDFAHERSMIYAVVDAINAGHIAACTDISDGGLITALCEMAMGGHGKGQYGFELELEEIETDLRSDQFLFSETSGFVMECREGHEEELKALFAGFGLELIELGHVEDEAEIEIELPGGEEIEMPLEELKDAWLNGLARVLR